MPERQADRIGTGRLKPGEGLGNLFRGADQLAAADPENNAPQHVFDGNALAQGRGDGAHRLAG